MTGVSASETTETTFPAGRLFFIVSSFTPVYHLCIKHHHNKREWALSTQLLLLSEEYSLHYNYTTRFLKMQ